MPELTVIDGPRALELLDTAVAERGADYRYSAPSGHICRYVHGDECGCIIGLALYRGDLATLETLAKWDALVDENGSCLSGIATVDVEKYGLQLKNGARQVFVTAQNAQDNNNPWGVARARAAEVLDEVQRAALT